MVTLFICIERFNYSKRPTILNTVQLFITGHVVRSSYSIKRIVRRILIGNSDTCFGNQSEFQNLIKSVRIEYGRVDARSITGPIFGNRYLH